MEWVLEDIRGRALLLCPGVLWRPCFPGAECHGSLEETLPVHSDTQHTKRSGSYGTLRGSVLSTSWTCAKLSPGRFWVGEEGASAPGTFPSMWSSYFAVSATPYSLGTLTARRERASQALVEVQTTPIWSDAFLGTFSVHEEGKGTLRPPCKASCYELHL